MFSFDSIGNLGHGSETTTKKDLEIPALPAILFAKYSECEQALDLADAQVVQDISCQGHYPCLSICTGHETRSQNIERKHNFFLF